MLDHVSLQVEDVDEAVRFYVGVFAPVGVSEVMRLPRGDSAVVALGGRGGGTRLWLGPLDESGPATAREVHLAFTAASQPRSRRCMPPPPHWVRRSCIHRRSGPATTPGYFAVYLRDPDGNNVEAVWHGV